MTTNMSTLAEKQQTEIPRKPPTKTSEHRRATKPIMEKRRRARINQSLTELKTLILDALNKDPSRHSKLEKADILEMTVRHLQNMQRQQMAAAISTDPSVLNKYRAGFSECANEVSRYVTRIDGVDNALRQRLISHLSNCVTSLNAAAAASSTPSYTNAVTGIAFPGMVPPPNGSPYPTSNAPLHVQIPLPAAAAAAIAAGLFPANAAASFASACGTTSGGDINNNNPTTPLTPSASSVYDGKQIISPPTSASSTASSHFTFTIPTNMNHQPSPPTRNHPYHHPHHHHGLNVNIGHYNEMNGPSTSGSIRLRQGSLSSWSRVSGLESPVGRGSISPVSSVGSGAISPTSSDHDVEMTSEPLRAYNRNSMAQPQLMMADSVWRPW